MSGEALKWGWPLPGRPEISDHFGWSPARGRMHRGADVMYRTSGDARKLYGLAFPHVSSSGHYYIPPGTQAIAPTAGTVAKVDTDAHGTWVRVAALDGAHAWVIRHLSAAFVLPGQAVELGAAVGLAGEDPANARDPVHIHIEVFRDGQVIDPARVLPGARPRSGGGAGAGGLAVAVLLLATKGLV